MNTVSKLFATSSASTSSNDIPSLEDVSPSFAETKARFAALNEEMISIDAQRQQLSSKIGRNGIGNVGVGERDVRIEKMIGRNVPSLANADTFKFNQLNEAKAEIKEAIRLLDIELEKEWLAASRLVCEKVAGQHRVLMVALYEKLVEVHALWFQHEEMLNKFRRGGIAHSGLMPQSPYFLGAHPGDRAGDLASWMRDLLRVGFIKKAALPEQYR